MTQPKTKPINAEQVKVFRDITLDYFGKIDQDSSSVQVGEAYLQFNQPLLLDYTSAVQIKGDYYGAVYITLPSAMIEQLLISHQETEISDRTRADMCRELSNVLSGNASRAFGTGWQISVPISITPENMERLSLPEASFILPASWRKHQWFLVLALFANSEEVA